MSVQIFLKCIFSDMKFKGVCVGGGGCNCFLSVPILSSYNFAIMRCMYGKKVETSFHSVVYFL